MNKTFFFFVRILLILSKLYYDLRCNVLLIVDFPIFEKINKITTTPGCFVTMSSLNGAIIRRQKLHFTLSRVVVRRVKLIKYRLLSDCRFITLRKKKIEIFLSFVWII